MQNDVRVSNWAELNEELFRDSWRDDLRRFRSNFAFRGMSSASEDLRTALQRGDYVEQESHLLRNFRKYASSEASGSDSIWNWLALAQHHGLPTRLLDWTYSPFVALHFATAAVGRDDREDAAVWCVDYNQTNAVLPKSLQKLLHEEGSFVFTAEMLKAAATSLRDFDAMSRDDFVVFFEPPSLDQRIVNQFALFALLSSPDTDLGVWLERHPNCYRRLIIPAELKWEVRDKLDQANITERVLFPGLDGLSSWLKRYYASKDR